MGILGEWSEVQGVPVDGDGADGNAVCPKRVFISREVFAEMFSPAGMKKFRRLP